MEFKDYYQILGVTEKADASAIKASYRKLARKYHPDVSKEDNAEAKFKDVGEAYAVLKDPEKRAEYDVLRTQGTHRGGSYQPPPDWQSSYTGNRTSNQNTDGDFSDFFDSIFGANGSGFRQTEGGQRPTNRRGHDLHYKIALSLEEAYQGCQRQIALRISEPAPNGSVKQRDKTLNVKIPAGVTEGQHIRLAGQGELGVGGGKAGDLLLDIEFAPHAYFTLDGVNILLTLPVTCWEAALGTTVEIPTISGKVSMKIPPASNSGNKLRIKGKGLVGKSGKASGDQIVTLQISLSKEHSSEAKALYQQLAQCESHFNPRQIFER